MYMQFLEDAQGKAHKYNLYANLKLLLNYGSNIANCYPIKSSQ